MCAPSQAASAAGEVDEDIYGGKSIADSAEARPAKRQRLDSGQDASTGDPQEAQTEDDEVKQRTMLA